MLTFFSHNRLAMLANQQHQVGRGYFITSRAPPVMHGDHSHGEVQRRDRQSLRDEHAAEEAFFNRQAGPDRAWPEEFAHFDDRCGIPQLVKFLAQTLAQEFARNLPELSRKLNSKLNYTRNALKSLPEMPQNPEYEVRKSLLKFTNDFQARLKSKAFSASWAKIAETFKTRIIGLKPRYRVMPEGFSIQRDTATATGSDRESVFSANNSPSLSVKRQRPIDLTMDVVTPSAQRRRGENGLVKVEEVGNRSLSLHSPATVANNPVTTSANGRVSSKTLDQIRNLIRSEREAGKPGEVPYDVIEFLCMEAVKPWSAPLHTFLDDTMLHLRRELHTSLEESFKELKKRQVFSNAKHLTKGWLKMHEARILVQLERIYDIETAKVYTMDDDSFQRHRAHEAHMLKRNRHFYRWKHYNGDTTPTKLEDWDKMTAEARRREESEMTKEAAKLGDDPHEVELGVASHVRGYYLTAAMRFIDIIAMHITSGLFPDLQIDIEQYLERKMELDKPNLNPDLFVSLMEEEQTTAERRVRLKAELERFEMAVREIHELNQTVMRASTNSSMPYQEDRSQSIEDPEGEVDMDEF